MKVGTRSTVIILSIMQSFRFVMIRLATASTVYRGSCIYNYGLDLPYVVSSLLLFSFELPAYNTYPLEHCITESSIESPIPRVDS